MRRYPWRVSYGARLLGGIVFFFHTEILVISTNVADPHYFVADPDPDPACHFDADPDLSVGYLSLGCGSGSGS